MYQESVKRIGHVTNEASLLKPVRQPVAGQGTACEPVVEYCSSSWEWSVDKWLVAEADLSMSPIRVCKISLKKM